MEGIPYDVMIDGVSLVFAIAGLIWAIRFTGLLTDRYAPSTAIALGVFFVAGFHLFPGFLTPIVRGIAAGTVASGGYAGLKKMVTNSPNPLLPNSPAPPGVPTLGLLPDPPAASSAAPPASPTDLPPLVPPTTPPVRPEHDPELQP